MNYQKSDSKSNAHARQIIDSIEGDPMRTPDDEFLISQQTGENFLSLKGRLEMQDDLYEAAKSPLPDASIAQVARRYEIPLDDARTIAHQQMKNRLGVDPEAQEFSKIVGQVKAIESIPDAGLREYKLDRLARRFKIQKSSMMAAYNKALINQAPFHALTIGELNELATQTQSWLINGWLPRGVVLLIHALGGVGKSLIAYEIAQCVATGQPWNGYPVTQGSVLILQSDEPTIVTRDRMEIRGITDSDPVKIVPGWQIEKMAQLEAYLKSAQDDNQPIKLCIVDSVTAVNRNSVISENDTEYARFMLQLNDLGDRFGVTFVVIHHSNSNGESRGTKALYNSASEVWGMSVADEQSGDRIVRVQKTRMGRPPGRYKFSFDEENFNFTYLGKEGEEQNQEELVHTEKRIELWLMEDEHRGKPYTIDELGHYLQINNNTLRRVVREMWAKGLIRRQKSGRAYTYFCGELTNREYSTDRQKTEIVKNVEVSFSDDQLISSSEMIATQELQTDHPTDRELIAPPYELFGDQFDNNFGTTTDTCDGVSIDDEVLETPPPLVADWVPEIGESVAILTTDGQWHRGLIEKLPNLSKNPIERSTFYKVQLPSGPGYAHDINQIRPLSPVQSHETA